MIKKFIILVVASMQVACAHPPSVPVLTYHRISSDATAPSGEDIQVSRFEQHLKMIKDEGYTTYTVSEMVAMMRTKREMPLRSVVLTFDDGWTTDLVAVRLLQKYNHKGTFYVLSGMFDAPRGTPSYLTRDELKSLASNSNVEIGTHTHTHFLQWANQLEAMPTNVVIDEMKKSKAIIEDVIGKPVKAFAWPFGYVRLEAQKQAASMGYTSVAEINRYSYNEQDVSPFRVQRLNIDGNCSPSQVKKMIDTGVLDKCK